MKKEIINLTPHDITFVDDEGNVILIVKPSGQLARVSVKTIHAKNTINGIPVSFSEFGEVEGLPAPKEGTIYIVSRMVADRVPDRFEDVFVPNESVRDDKGRIIGCKSLGTV